MKTSFYYTGALALSFSAVILFGCEKSQELEPSSVSNQIPVLDVTKSNTISPLLTESLKNVGSDKILAAVCENYSLVLSGVTGTPHVAGLNSFVANVDMVTGATTAASQIMIGAVPVRTVTGITRIPTAVPTLYGVTGQNSNIPRRLIRIDAATGASVNVGATVSVGGAIALQDIEFCPANNRFYAILEGTNVIMVSNNALNWTQLAVAPTNFRLNGLTFRTVGAITTLWVIAGQGNTVCAANFGDMYNFDLVGGFIGADSYNAALAGPTTPELGLDFYGNAACIVRNFVIGSASGVLSNNMLLCSGGGIPGPIGAGAVRATYDFAKR